MSETKKTTKGERHFNGLTPGEAERLALLSEELGEAQQVIGKILRHGYDSQNPVTLGPANRELLEMELGDVIAAGRLLASAGDISLDEVNQCANDKLDRVGQYLHHQPAALLRAVEQEQVEDAREMCGCDAAVELVREAVEIMNITYAGNFPSGIESFLVRADRLLRVGIVNCAESCCPQQIKSADLLAALKGVVQVADRDTREFIAARAAIAKAEGV